MRLLVRRAVPVSDKALAVGSVECDQGALTPAASALPLTGQPPRELDEIATAFVSRKALAAGSSVWVTDRIVSNMSDKALAVGDAAEPAANASPLTRVPDRIVEMMSRKALAAGAVAEPAASALPLTMIGELSQ